jgi:hypothetical protein
MKKTKSVVLVLGAGSSVDYNFPVGTLLKEDVIKHLIGSSDVASRRTGARLGSMNPDSLDDFARQIGHEPIPVGFVKKAIAKVILDYEAKTIVNFAKVREGDEWMRKLAEQLFTSNAEGPKTKVTVITFNYDRVLEWRLFAWVRDQQELSDFDAWSKVYSSVEIHHVYGRLPALDEHETTINASLPASLHCSFGNRIDDRLGGISKGLPHIESTVIHHAPNFLRTIYEAPTAGQYSLESESSKYRDILLKADAIHILGFGFNHQNLQILGLPFGDEKESKFVFKRESSDGLELETTVEDDIATFPIVNCLAYPGDGSNIEQRIWDFRKKNPGLWTDAVIEMKILRYINSQNIFD